VRAGVDGSSAEYPAGEPRQWVRKAVAAIARDAGRLMQGAR